jgi:hypothetical protein
MCLFHVCMEGTTTTSRPTASGYSFPSGYRGGSFLPLAPQKHQDKTLGTPPRATTNETKDNVQTYQNRTRLKPTWTNIRPSHVQTSAAWRHLQAADAEDDTTVVANIERGCLFRSSTRGALVNRRLRPRPLASVARMLRRWLDREIVFDHVLSVDDATWSLVVVS